MLNFIWRDKSDAERWVGFRFITFGGRVVLTVTLTLMTCTYAHGCEGQSTDAPLGGELVLILIVLILIVLIAGSWYLY